MKKIKELLKRLETALLKKPWAFANLTRFRNYLTKILAGMELFHIRRDIQIRIDTWETEKAAHRTMVSAIMENVLNSIGHEMSASHRSDTQKLTHKVAALLNLEVAKRLVTQLSNIVGIQPIKSPVGLVFLMQYKYADAENELGTGKKMTLEIISQAVEATSRRLSAGWTIEAMQDLTSMHKLDIEAEITKLTAHEITHEYVAEILGDLLRLGTQVDLSELKLVNTFDASPVDNAKRLLIEINRAASHIAMRTRRGAGNVVIAPIHAISMLQALPEGIFVAAEPAKFDSGSLLFAGTLNGYVKVYTSLLLNDKIIVGYKGSNEVDAGYILSPYLPAIYSGVVVNPVSFQPLAAFLTRYSKAINGSREQAGEYYRVLTLDIVEPTPVPEDLVSEEA